MAVIGLILMGIAVAFGIELVVSNLQTTTAEVFNTTVGGVTAGGFFLVGVVAGAVFLLGLALMMSSIGRARRRRAAVREIVQDKEATLSGLVEENAALRADLADERRSRETLGGYAVPPAQPAVITMPIADPYPTEAVPVTNDATNGGRHLRKDHESFLERLRH